MNEIRVYFKVNEKIATSGQPTIEQFTKIADSDYDVVVNLAMPTSDFAIENEGSIVNSLGMTYVHIPVTWENPQLSDVLQFFAVMRKFEGKNIWVHYALNMRASCFMYLYQLHVLQLPESQATFPMSQVWSPTGVWDDFINAAKKL